MKVLVLVVHPHLEKSVINKTWKEAAEKAGSNITVRSLYDLYPDGNIDIREEQKVMESHDRIIFQYPFYWYSAPYLLKKFMDEVFTDGWAYGAGGDKMEGKEIGAAVSCGSPAEAFVEGGMQCHTLEHYLGLYDGVAAFLRARYIGFHAFYDTYNPTALQTLPQNADAYAQWLTK